MIYALNRSFKIVRTVYKSEVNDIYVCKAMQDQTGHFYTLITFKEEHIKKELVNFFAEEERLKTNNDFIGSFASENCFNMLFNYHEERKLFTYLETYRTSFGEKKYICQQLVSAVIASKLPASMIPILLKPSNINVNKNKTIYFNYFMEFTNFEKNKETNHYTYLSEIVFEILAKGYENIYNENHYPKELRLFYKKLKAEGFNSFSQIYKYLNLLPEELVDEKSLLYTLRSFWWRIKAQVKIYSFWVVVGIVIAVTSVFTMDQLNRRFQAVQTMKEVQLQNANVYDGMYEIGTVKVHTLPTSKE